MPTKRTRRGRSAAISTEAQSWLVSDDAVKFFADPDAYERDWCYRGQIQNLPGIKPWWPPLATLYSAHLAGELIPGREAQRGMDEQGFAFVLALAEEAGARTVPSKA